MSENLKVQLVFKDRIGIVFDVTKLMSEQGLSIVSMEVAQKDGFAQIALEIEKLDDSVNCNTLFALFETLPDLVRQSELRQLPQEKRQRWLRTMFDGMSEGIISVDAGGFINTINSVACHTLDVLYKNVIGHHVSEISPKDSILLDCITKRIPVSRRKVSVTDTGRVEFYGSAKPIKDSHGNFIGAVLLMKNLKEVKEMVDAVSTPLDVRFDDFIGQTPAIKNLITFAKKIADTGAIISITGESGTGKELFARAIHFESGRKGPFVPINCAALPEQLIESELFGYADGAFTGARKKGKPGLFEAAKNGTIFLDEIGDMPQGPQAKILRVLQDGLVRRIGGVDEIPVNARVITATNKNLKDMVIGKRFREDLFYRINVLAIQIPPLKERLMDIPLIAEDFLHQFNKKLGKADQTISKEAMARLYNHSWPGNVRELKNVIERASILSDSSEIHIDSILISHERDEHGGLPRCQATRDSDVHLLKERVGSYESVILLETLNASSSVRQAARKLGISHTALLKKIEKYQLVGGNKTNQWCKKEPSE
jgi:transcriptional regulator of aroF, aroG, tyrA and aromatic amino acid transport